MEEISYNSIERLHSYLGRINRISSGSGPLYNRKSRAWGLWEQQGIDLPPAQCAVESSLYLPVLLDGGKTFTVVNKDGAHCVGLPMGSHDDECLITVVAKDSEFVIGACHVHEQLLSLMEGPSIYVSGVHNYQIVLNKSSYENLTLASWACTTRGNCPMIEIDPARMEVYEYLAHRMASSDGSWECHSYLPCVITDPTGRLRANRSHVITAAEFEDATWNGDYEHACYLEDEYDAHQDRIPHFDRKFQLFFVTMRAMTGSLLSQLHHYKIQYCMWSPKFEFLANGGFKLLLLSHPNERVPKHSSIRVVHTYSKWTRSHVAHSRHYYDWSLLGTSDGRCATYVTHEVTHIPWNMVSRRFTDDETGKFETVFARIIPLICRTYLSRQNPQYAFSPGVIPHIHFPRSEDWVALCRKLAFSCHSAVLLKMCRKSGVGMMSSILSHIELWHTKAYRLDRVQVPHTPDTLRDLHRSTFTYPTAGHLISCIEGSLQLFLSFVWFLICERWGYTPYVWVNGEMLFDSQTRTHTETELLDAIEWVLSDDSFEFFGLTHDRFHRDPIAHYQIIQTRAKFLLLILSHSLLPPAVPFTSRLCLVLPSNTTSSWLLGL